MAINYGEAKKMVEASERYGGKLQIGLHIFGVIRVVVYPLPSCSISLHL